MEQEGRSMLIPWPFFSHLWLGIGVFLMATSIRIYAMCQQLQAQAQAHAQAHAAATAGSGGLVGHTELRVRMPPSIAFATRGRLQGLRLQLALLDREFDDLDYDALRALDGDNLPHVDALNEAEINCLPIHKYKSSSSYDATVSSELSDTVAAMAPVDVVSSSDITLKREVGTSESKKAVSDEELTCSVCLEQVVDGEMVRSLPCLHQFHASCIDQWLRQQATCPVCKFKLMSGWQEGTAGRQRS